MGVGGAKGGGTVCLQSGLQRKELKHSTQYNATINVIIYFRFSLLQKMGTLFSFSESDDTLFNTTQMKEQMYGLKINIAQTKNQYCTH